MGAFADDSRPIVGGTPGTQCRVAKVLESGGLDAEDADALREWVADRGIEARALSRRCSDHGIDLSAGVIQRHRRGDCKCDG